MEQRSAFTHRLARREDMAALKPLMDAAIAELLKPYLPPEGVAASFSIMGLDTQLIDDGTYFVVEHEGRIVGGGGWSRRATLFGGDHSAGRDARRLDPKTEPARVRAMYTHPDWTRRGIGRLVLQLCEEAAGREGFTRCELAATLAGEPLYRACGFYVVDRFEAATPSGYSVPLLRMEKKIGV
jgi:GNAT superfamily N-acetyltransferase